MFLLTDNYFYHKNSIDKILDKKNRDFVMFWQSFP